MERLSGTKDWEVRGFSGTAGEMGKSASRGERSCGSEGWEGRERELANKEGVRAMAAQPREEMLGGRPRVPLGSWQKEWKWR